MLPATDLAADSRSLDRLKTQATKDPAAAGKEAARQFEALFMQSLIKSMRDAMPKGDLFGGQETETYTAMLDQQLSQTFAGRPGGLAESIARQINRLTAKPAAMPDKATAASGAAASASATAPDGKTTAAVDGKRLAPFSLAKAIVPTTLETWRFAPLPTPAPAGAPAGATTPGAPAASPGTARVPSASTGPTAALARATPLTQAQQAFVEKLRQPALDAQRSTGIPADFIIAQAALETGWGQREILQPDGTPSRNLFGMKAGAGWSGASVASATTEYASGKALRQTGNFRAYASYADSINDWVRLISGSDRYSAVIRDGRTAEGFADGLQKAGYATDPNYAQKLTRMINRTVALKNASSQPI